MLVGRERELRMVEGALARAAASQGGAIVVSGEPGMGKTSLLRYLRMRAEDQGFRVFQLHSLPSHVSGIDAIWKRIWWELVAEERLENSSSASDLAHDVCSPVKDAFKSIVAAVRNLSRHCPLLLAVDDIHHTDPVSLELLELLARSFESLPAVLVLAHCRAAMVGRSEGNRVIDSIAARGRCIELAGVDETATGQILLETAGFEPEEWVVRSIRRLTGGNPRFILACESLLSEPDLLHPSRSHEIKIPNTVRAAINERLKPLSAAARKVLETVVFFRGAVELRLLSRLLCIVDDELHELISELENGGLMARCAADTYDCTHGFTRELLYRETPIHKRSELHCRIASALETAESGAIANALQIFEHHICSGEPGNLERARHYAQLAGTQFTTQATPGSMEMFSAAVSIAEAQSAFDRGAVCSMLIDLATVQRRTWQIEAAQQTFSRAAKLAQNLSDSDKLTQIALGMPDLGWPLGYSTNPSALMMAEKALAAMAPDDSASKALLMARVAGELAFIPDRRALSEQLFAQAVETGLRLRNVDESVMWRIRHLRDRLLRRPDLIEDRLSNADQMIQIAYKTGDNDALFASAFIRFCVMYESGDIGAAEMQTLLMQQAAALVDRPEHRSLLLHIRAAISSHSGRNDLAQELCREARETADLSASGTHLNCYWPSLILPLREQGRLAELAPLAENTFGMRACLYAFRALACWVAFELGNTSLARWQLDVLAAKNFADLLEGPYSLVAAALLADVSAGLKTSHAAPLYEFLSPFKHRRILFEPGLLCFGSVSLHLGKLALLLSDYDAAVSLFCDAVGNDRKTGARGWLGYSLLELARALIARNGPGDRERATEIVSAAEAEAAALNMHMLSRRVGELASSSDARLESGRLELNHNASKDIGLLPATRLPEPESVTSLLEPAVSLRQNTSGWELTFRGVTVELKELRGLTQIAHLLSKPNEAISCGHLAALGKNGESLAEGIPPSDLGPILDDNAKSAYRARIRDLRQELEAARSSGREEAALRLEEELRFLTREIARAVGLFGRDRKSGSEAERARVRVTSSIKFAINKIAENDPLLGSYLRRTIRTGGSCCYTPESV
jgi:predicted ATPase